MLNLCCLLQVVAEDNNGKLKVYLRVRPLKSTEVEKGEDQVRHRMKQSLSGLPGCTWEMLLSFAVYATASRKSL